MDPLKEPTAAALAQHNIAPSLRPGETVTIASVPQKIAIQFVYTDHGRTLLVTWPDEKPRVIDITRA